MSDHQALLAQYVENGSEVAFRELVDRYINFVYATAVRLVDGDTHLAEDITQTVFLDLARQAKKLPPNIMLGGWLHRDTCFVASKVRRGEQRRQAREQEAMLMKSLQDHPELNHEPMGPILDEAINQLTEDDRNAIILRFYEQRDFRAVGAALGSNEDAARMRVKRALDKLQAILKGRGITRSAAALTLALTTIPAVAAPASLSAAVASTALAGATASAATIGFLQGVTMMKMKLAITAPLLAVGVAGTLWYQSQAKLRETAEQLRLSEQKIAALQADYAELNRSLAQNAGASEPSRELLKLRGEIGLLKKQLAEASVKQMSLPENIDQQMTDPEKQRIEGMLRQQYLTRMKVNHAKQWALALHMYAVDHEGNLPQDFGQVTRYLPNDEMLHLATNGFSITYSGPLSPTSNRYALLMSTPEMNIPGDPSGGWTMVCAFTDGSVEKVERADGNFDEWAMQHLPPQAE